MQVNHQQKQTILGCVLLCLVTFVAFWPVIHNGFINYDDGDYVTGNPHVLGGLTWANVRWAFTTTGSFYWQPLTWISHMLDVQFFGLNPHWHHLIGLLMHSANAVVLFLLLQRMTGAMWRSLFVAALFATHPLRVESVAWVAERKDLLSTFFCLLTIWAYARYAEKETSAAKPGSAPDPGSITAKETLSCGTLPLVGHIWSTARFYYTLSLALYAFGLMSKPMVVTLPFALLLLDYWPLCRFDRLGAKRIPVFVHLVREKIPFFCMAATACLITILATARSHAMVGGLPIGLRTANAVASYLRYLGKTIWPTNLAVFYPHPNTRCFSPETQGYYPASEQWPYWQIFAAALLLISVSGLVLLRRRSEPWLFTGWYWYLGTLVPVIGLVQAGMQAMADRFTYIPLIGIVLALTWGACELTRGRAFARGCLVVAGVLALGASVLTTRKQVAYWRNDRTLFTRALAVTSRNSVAEWMIGAECAKEGQLGLAQTHFRLALAADPFQVEAHSALGSLFELEGRTDLATNEYNSTLRMKPQDEFARLHLADIFRKLGRAKEALAEYEETVRWNPDSVEANYQAGALLMDLGKPERAAGFLETALRLKPDHADALLCMSDLRAQQGRTAEAIAALAEVVRLYPTNFELRVNLGSLFWKSGRREAALGEYREALRLNTAHPMVHYNLGAALFAQGDLAGAGKELSEAVRLKPDYLEARVDLGRALTAQGKFKEAQDAFQSALPFSPTNAGLYENLGNALLLGGQTNEANAAFAKSKALLQTSRE